MTFDTFAYAEGLKSSGFSEEQVRALTQELTKALKSEELATKSDIKDFATKSDLAELKTDITRWVTGMMAIQTGIIVTIVVAAIKLL